MKHTTIISIALITLAVNVFAQPPDTLWTRTFGGDSADYCQSVHQTGDGGFIAGGYTKSFGAGNYDFCLVKTDAEGNEEWSRTIGGSSLDWCFDLQITTDGGYILVGQTHSYGAGESDVYLVKTDSLGNEEWFRTYGDRRQDWGRGVQQTSDGGFIITGHTSSFGTADQSVYLVKTDSLGNEIWYRTFGQGNMGVNAGYCVQQTSDGGYILTGNTSPTVGGYDVLLLKTDSLGNEEWRRTFGGGYNDFGYDLKITADRGYIIAGSGRPLDDSEVYLIKTNSFGIEEWSRYYGDHTTDEAWSVVQTLEGDYIVAGNVGSTYMMKVDSTGNELWSVPGIGFGLFLAQSVCLAFDGDIVVGGDWTNYSNPYFALVRHVGNFTFTMTPLLPVITIPSFGGNFDFTASLENLIINSIVFDAWTEVILPNGNRYGSLILRRELSIPAGFHAVRQITQVVPGNAPAGYYRYIGNVGVYPNTIWKSDGFEFVKRPGE